MKHKFRALNTSPAACKLAPCNKDTGHSPHPALWSVLVPQNSLRSGEYLEITHFHLSIDKSRADQNCLARAICRYPCQSDRIYGTESSLNKTSSGQVIGIHNFSTSSTISDNMHMIWELKSFFVTMKSEPGCVWAIVSIDAGFMDMCLYGHIHAHGRSNTRSISWSHFSRFGSILPSRHFSRWLLAPRNRGFKTFRGGIGVAVS